ncbi:hypothetical protein [Nonomuraea sp. SYSU D8015]|uniref:hypothetical protein n=1 Tax=Nonomuraea sp. SYSU D8015 TaxID=2593644 RepID=UPI001660E492|nr:hypothetical protein [Nonomuraea sp. SYSU D8015]
MSRHTLVPLRVNGRPYELIVGMLVEVSAEQAVLTDAEIRERLAGNLCRGGA